VARTFTVQPLAKVTPATTSGLSANRVAGSIAWQPVAGATRYELALTDETRLVTRTLRISGTSYSIVNGLAFGMYRLQVRALNGTAEGAWSIAKVINVKLGVVTNLVIPQALVGRGDRVTWASVSGASVGYGVLIRRIDGTIVHRGTTAAAFYNLPKNLPVGRFQFAVRSRSLNGMLSQNVLTVKSLNVADLPAQARTVVDGIAAVAGNQRMTLIVRDARLQELGRYSTPADLGVKLASLSFGQYGVVVKTVSNPLGYVVQVREAPADSCGDGVEFSADGGVASERGVVKNCSAFHDVAGWVWGAGVSAAGESSFRLSLAADEFVLIRQWLQDEAVKTVLQHAEVLCADYSDGAA